MTIDCQCDYCGAALVRNAGVSERHYCDSQCKREWQRLQKPVTREWLEEQYIALGKDCTQIAHIVKRDPKSVWNWLKDLGIPTRPRGSNVGQLPKDGSTFKGHHHTQAVKNAVRAARLKDGRVPYLKNGVHHLKGKRGAETPNWKGGITPERQAVYNTQEWRDCVKMVWARDDAKCRRCGLDHRSILRGTRRFELHHLDGFAVVERRTDPSNVILLCDRCHMWVHSKKNRKRQFLGEGHRSTNV